MSRVHELLEELESYVEAAEQKLEVAGVKPRYALGQKVWILKADAPSWYTFPIHSEDTKIEDIFEEEEIETIVLSRLHDSATIGCRVPNENPIVVVYTFNRYYQYDNRFIEEKVYPSLQEAINKNKSAFDKELNKFKEESTKEKAEKKKQLQQQLSEL
jgi:hypothetical protein